MLTGNEQLRSSTASLENATVLDFWRWAFSNLQMNDVRGVFAEWIVAKLLNIPLNVRDPWSEWDLITRDGVRIEVKASAYLQAWSQKQPSRIVFTGLKGRRLDTRTNSTPVLRLTTLTFTCSACKSRKTLIDGMRSTSASGGFTW